MALGDTYYVVVHTYIYDYNMDNVLYDFGRSALFLPFIDVNNHPSFGSILNNGTPSELMAEWDAAFSGFRFLNNIAIVSETWYANNTLLYFLQSFPNYILRVGDYDNTMSLVCINETNGVVFVHRGTGSSRHIYNNFDDAKTGTNALAQSSAATIDLGIGPNTSSGSNRGYAYGLCYTNFAAETPIDIRIVNFKGVTGTTGATKVSSIDAISSGNYSLVQIFFSGAKSEAEPIGGVDPYGAGGTTDTGGGTGTFSDTSTPVDFPALPSVSAVDAGFIKLYNPTLAQLNSLAAYMWTGLDLTAFKKIFADPMECILGLSLVPVAVPDGSTEEIYVGNIGTGVNMTKANSQYVEVDCGTLEVKEFWGAYLDFSPYTKLELYLPYIGIHQVDADEIVGKTIHIKYHVDILTGACIAYVKCGDSVLYSFNGQCSANVPLTSRDWTNTLNGIISIAGSIGSLVASGGANAPSAISNIASSAMNAVKPTIEKSGSLSGVGGMMGIQTPYLILTRPKQALPEGQNAFSGYPSFITVTLSEITGYAEIESIHLENIPCTGAELSEIEAILKEGVIL